MSDSKPNTLVVDVPVIETYESIMNRYGEAQGMVLHACAKNVLRDEDIKLPPKPSFEDYCAAAKELKPKGLKLMAAIAILKPTRDPETGHEQVDQIVFCDVVPESLTPGEYRDAILRANPRMDPKKARFHISDFSLGGLRGFPKA